NTGGGFVPLKITTHEESVIRKGPASSFAVSFPQGVVWALIACAASFGVAMVGERRNGLTARLEHAPLGAFELLASRALAALLSMLLISVLLFAVAALVFGLRPASWGLLVLAVFQSSLCFVGLSLCFSLLGKSEQAASGIGWGIMSLLAMLGGGMIPLIFMPGWMQTLSRISPVRWVVVSLEGAIWRGFSLAEMLVPGAVLLAIWGMVVSPGDGAVADGDSRFGMRDRMQIEAYFAGRGQTLSPAEFNQVKNSIRAQRGKVLAGSLWKEAVVLLLLGGVLVMYSRGSVKEGGLAVLLLVLGVADAKPEYGKALHFSPRQSILQELRPDPMIQHLQGLASQDLFRVWPKGVYPYNQLIAWNLQSVLGYQGARLNITDQFLDAGAAQGYGMDREIHPHVLDVLNVKYTIAREMLEGQVVVGKQQDQLLLSRESAAERVSLPGRITTVASPKDALERILAPDFDARSEVVLLESPGFTSNATGSARVTDYQDEEMTIEVTCDGPGVLQISEIFYPNGWTASVNGQDAAILNSNFATRAILLPAAGDHRIVLRFAPTDFRLGAGISGLTLLAMLGAWGVLWFRGRRKD
ncbi:MAG: ABC transporter permease, partial [Candidatus Cloacimonetes bacterium]|nr:ABC transporter permease [Candidatus Cloacimonadota bacterium]